MRARRGFTLLELLVATAIMGIAVVTLLSTLSTSVRSAARLTEYDRVAMLARSHMDGLLLDQRLPKNELMEGVFDPVQLGGAKGGWRARVTAFEPPPEGAPIDLLERVALEIWWQDGVERRSFLLDGYRRGLP